MKKAKLTLGLVTTLLAVAGLSACNEVTSHDGVVLTFKDASGSRISYTARELFGEYQKNSGVASTDFDHIQEVLIRKYYESASQASVLASLKLDAENDVLGIKKTAESNATANKTSYAAEFEKLLKTNGAEDVDELFQIKLYEREKKKFTTDYESDDQIMFMRDGKDASGKDMFPYSEDYGRGSDGYLKEQMPYTVRHILVKLTQATNGDHTQAKITEAESSKLGSVVMRMAGATKEERESFGDIAANVSEDPGSKAQWGRLDVMDRDQADNFIQEFRFGVYAYDAIYNKVNRDATKNAYAQAEFPVPDGSGDKYKIIDSLSYSDDATYTDFSKAQTADEIASGLQEGEHFIKNYFTNDFSEIGVIPYGAAVALENETYAKNPKLDFRVNDDSETFYPRNIIFNKYFNNHRVAVIVPTRISLDDAIDGKETKLADGTKISSTVYDKDNELKLAKGIKDTDYAALPGFAKDTSAVLDIKDADGNALNCLTTEKGQIILAVRGGSSGSYEGIHFIVIDRSALELYADATSTEVTKLLTEEEYEAAAEEKNVNSLSEYYTIFTPDEEGYPTFQAVGAQKPAAKSTYVNPYSSVDKDPYSEKADKIRSKVSSYNSSKDTFIFQQLISDSGLQFAANDEAREVQKLVLSWIRSKRNSGAIKGRENFDDSWATYIEYLTQQDQSRELNAKGTQRLISETCALGYGNDDSKNKEGAWAVGGACYAK